jgi:hypothetical protein
LPPIQITAHAERGRVAGYICCRSSRVDRDPLAWCSYRVVVVLANKGCWHPHEGARLEGAL